MRLAETKECKRGHVISTTEDRKVCKDGKWNCRECLRMNDRKRRLKSRIDFLVKELGKLETELNQVKPRVEEKGANVDEWQ